MADYKNDNSNTSLQEPTKRDFLYLTAAAFGAVGVGSVAWPFIHSLNPAADTLALATAEFSIAGTHREKAVTVTWRGKPVFIRRRTPDEIKQAEETKLDDL